MKEIKLNDILNFTEEELNSVKIKLNVYDGWSSPLEEYKNNPEVVDNDWFLFKSKDGKYYFYEGEIGINCIPLGDDAWLITSIKKIDKRLDVKSGIANEASEITKYKKYFGRIVIHFHKNMRGTVLKFANYCNDFNVLQILPTIFDDDEFPGYENVRLTYQALSQILSRKKASWIGALQNQKAVYLITDTKTGKLYVGSATSQYGMLLQRWKSYIDNGTGGNKALEELKAKKGFDYIKKYFQYSILENYNARMDDYYILERESWWKETLKSREFGYNEN